MNIKKGLAAFALTSIIAASSLSVFTLSLPLKAEASGLGELGEILYMTKCASCHGREGEGSSLGPSFFENEFVTFDNMDAVQDVILSGRLGKDRKYKDINIDMPPNSLLTATELHEVTSYIINISETSTFTEESDNNPLGKGFWSEEEDPFTDDFEDFFDESEEFFSR